MNIRVRTLAINPCGCGFEGSIRMQLVDFGIEISCSYIGMNDEVISEAYKVGSITNAPVFLAFGAIKRTTKRTPSLSPMVVGQFVGWTMIEGDSYGVVDALMPIPVDNELGDPILYFNPGDWVECSGELTLSHKNENG
ncbi:MAG: hypothetical protein V4640_09725 [Verrucomicrobiota bacterium]